MPYQWQHIDAGEELRLWPHRSLPATGFVGFIGTTAAFIALPLLAVLGTPVLWGLLPFLVLAVAAVWWGLKRSYRDGQLLEVATITAERFTVNRHEPNGTHRQWTGPTYWVRVCLHHEGGPVEEYLTLKGGDREIELGRFLSPEERRQLALEITDLVQKFKRPSGH